MGADNSGAQSNCGFLAFAQIEPSMIPEELMRDVESELQKPTGKWTAKVFPPHLNGVLISRDCGILYRLRNAVGLRYVNVRPWRMLTWKLHRSQLFFRKVTTCALNILSDPASFLLKVTQMLVSQQSFI